MNSPAPFIFKTMLDSFFFFYRNLTKKKPVLFGLDPLYIEKNILFDRGSIKFDGLEVKYVITNPDNKANDDLIFFLHGAGRSEMQWLDKNGFARQFYQSADSYTLLKDTAVVSISFGMSFLLINKLPFPFEADLLNTFVEQVIPYFRNRLNKNGRIFLIGYSLGGYNALILSTKHPLKFPVVLVIFPFVSRYSPFQEFFIRNNHELKKQKLWASILKGMLLYAFKNKREWEDYDPIKRIENNRNAEYPFIIFSRTRNELAGFKENIEYFNSLLTEKGIDHIYLSLNGSHHYQDAGPVFQEFIKKINSINEKDIKQ